MGARTHRKDRTDNEDFIVGRYRQRAAYMPAFPLLPAITCLLSTTTYHTMRCRLPSVRRRFPTRRHAAASAALYLYAQNAALRAEQTFSMPRLRLPLFPAPPQPSFMLFTCRLPATCHNAAHKRTMRALNKTCLPCLFAVSGFLPHYFSSLLFISFSTCASSRCAINMLRALL